MAGRFSVEAVFKAIDRVTAPVTRMQNRIGKFTRATQRSFQRLEKSVSKVTRSLRKASAFGLKALTVGVGGLTAGVALLMREFSKVENAEAAFTPLLRGAKKAKALVAALNKTAATTPFQFNTLSDAAKQLLPVMDGNINKIIKTIRMLGDTAGGNANKLDSIVRGFTKAMLKGKVDMESLNMIGEAGVPIFKDLAAVMGRKVNMAFFKMISAGRVSTKDLISAFERMTKKGGIFFKGMEIASKTTTGMFSTLQDNVSLTAATLGGVLAPTIKDLIQKMTDVAKSVRAWVEANKSLINKKFLQFVDLAKQGIVKLFEAMVFLKKHGGTILKITGYTLGSIAALKTFILVMTAVNVVMAANPLGLAVMAVMALVAGFVALYQNADLVKEKLSDAAYSVTQKWGRVKEFFKNLGEYIQVQVTDPIINAFDKINSMGLGAFNKIGNFLGFNTDASGTGGGASAQMVSPAERNAKLIEENRTTSTAEVTIRADSGTSAEVTGGKMGTGLKLQQTGAF